MWKWRKNPPRRCASYVFLHVNVTLDKQNQVKQLNCKCFLKRFNWQAHRLPNNMLMADHPFANLGLWMTLRSLTMQPVRTRKSKGGIETCRVMTWHDSYNSEPTILNYQPTLADANDGWFSVGITNQKPSGSVCLKNQPLLFVTCDIPCRSSYDMFCLKSILHDIIDVDVFWCRCFLSPRFLVCFNQSVHSRVENHQHVSDRCKNSAGRTSTPLKINMEPKNHPFFKRKIIWIKPPWRWVQHVNFPICTPQKFSIDTKNGHIQKEPPFSKPHHFGYPAVRFRECELVTIVAQQKFRWKKNPIQAWQAFWSKIFLPLILSPPRSDMDGNVGRVGNPPPPKTNRTMAGKSTTNESMYFLLKNREFLMSC